MIRHLISTLHDGLSYLGNVLAVDTKIAIHLLLWDHHGFENCWKDKQCEPKPNTSNLLQSGFCRAGACRSGKENQLISKVCIVESNMITHDDVIKWKHFPRHWPFVRGIHRSPVNSPHKGQWRGALMFSLICAWINSWVNNREAGDLRRYRAHYDVTVMLMCAWNHH